MRRVLALLLLWATQAHAQVGVTYYFDPAGSDAAAGSAAAPWKTWTKFTTGITSGTIGPGARVLFRPGRYYACEAAPGNTIYHSLEAGGGTAANPITVQIQTKRCSAGNTGASCESDADCGIGVCQDLPGDVEINGSAKPGLCGVPNSWTPASVCVGGYEGAFCDSSAECGGGTCTALSTVQPGTSVYWAYSTLDNDAWYLGVAGGVAYQPNKTAGGAPKIYEILYAPDTARVLTPTWAPGHAQVMPYGTNKTQGTDTQGKAIPVAPHQITVRLARTFIADIGVTINGAPATKVASNPGPGQYSVSGGTYTFNAANQSAYAAITYSMGYCESDKTPWRCCTGLGTGTCGSLGTAGSSRMYVQTDTGVRPDLVADATYDNVEYPFRFAILWNNAFSGPTLDYLTFTNNGNGRKFRWWWTVGNSMMLRNVEHLTFEDIDLGYMSRVNSQVQMLNTTYANTSKFPRYIGGETYLISGWSQGGSNVVRNLTFRRLKIHASAGNEMFHLIGGLDTTRHGNVVVEQSEFCDGPYAVPNGTAQTTCTPNAYSNQVTKSWPPPGYAAWAGVMNMGHWGPIGGGGNTDGPIISTTFHQTFRANYFHSAGLISFFEGGGSGSLLFENNLVDLEKQFWGDSGYFPNSLLTYCGAPTGCGGLEGRLALGLPTRWAYSVADGPIVRNNVFINAYANAIRLGDFSGETIQQLPFAALTPTQIVNNTFIVPGDYNAALQNGCQQLVPTIWASTTPWHIKDASNRRAIIKNNIVVRTGASTCGLNLFQIDPYLLQDVDVDYNNWGGTNTQWRVGNTITDDFATYRSAIQSQTGLAAAESHALNVDPLFRKAYTQLAIQDTPPCPGAACSPSYRTGVDLAATGFDWDYAYESRPSGLWSMGAYQTSVGAALPASTIPTTTVPSTTTTSTTATTLPGSTTTSTTTTTTSSTTTTTFRSTAQRNLGLVSAGLQ